MARQKLVMRNWRAIEKLRKERSIVILYDKEKKIGDVVLVDIRGKKIGDGMILDKKEVSKDDRELLEKYLPSSGYVNLESWLRTINGRGWLYLVKLKRVCPKRYTKEEIQFVKENYGKMKIGAIANKLGRSYKAVENLVSRLNLED